MLPDPALTVEETPLPEDVREFCERHALFDHLARAMELARQYFTIVGEPVVVYEQDPDNGEEYLVLEIQVPGSVSERVESRFRFGGAWTQFASLPEVRLIRLVAFPAPNPNPIRTVGELTLSEEVREFCERHELFGHLAKALDLARQHFTIVGEPVIAYEQDPDNGEEYLMLEIQARGSVSEVVETHSRYTRDWLQFADLPEGRLIRFFPYSC